MFGYPVLHTLVVIAFNESGVEIKKLETVGMETNLPLLTQLADNLKRENSTTARVDVFVEAKKSYRKVKTFIYTK